ncbi:MAG: TonB-dependent receptor [Myxococcota bacterium]|nr:TonB-dependent receptor [Myxococcota bacterium]
MQSRVRFQASAWVVLLLALPGVPALGEEPSGYRRLPTARVTAVRPAELPEAPSSFATVIEAEDYAGEEETVEGLIDDVVGVQVRSFGGPGQQSEISIRGSTGQQVIILLDGVRLNTAQSGTVDLSTIPIAIVDRIEVSRGGGATRVGSGAIGGVVNVVTRRPGGKPRTSAEFSGGSFGTWRGSLSHAAVAGGLDYGASYAGFSTKGDWHFQSVEVRAAGQPPVESVELERVNNSAESHSALLQVAGDLAPGLRLSASDQAYFVSRGQPGPAQSRTAHERRSRNVAQLKLEAAGWDPLPGPLRLESRVSYLYERSRFREPNPELGDPIATRQRNRSASWRTLAEIEHDSFGLEQLAWLAFDVRYDSLSSNEQGFHERWNTAVTLRDELGFLGKRVEFVPSLRWDYADDLGSEWIPHVGLIVTPVKWLRLKANAGRSYRAPDFDELFFPDKGYIRGNPNLQPERAWNLDVGLELGVAKLWRVENIRLQVAYFYQDIENSIVFQQIGTNTVAPTNTKDATVRGLEFAAGLTLAGWLELSANWTHQKAQLDRARLPGSPGLFPPILQFPGTALPGQADDEYLLRARLGPRSGFFKIVAERRHTSKLHLSFTDVPTLSARSVYDLSASFDLAHLWGRGSRGFPEKLIASIAVTNLTDESVRDSVGFPQPGRVFRFGLEGRW